MIVRDEEAVLPRCLDSAMAHVDEIIVVDTGSVDATPCIARDAGATVYHRDWRNFGSNRSELLTLARSSADYLLLLDADDELLTLTRDPCELAYNFQIVTPGVAPYLQPRLISTAIDWRYEGVTHEYLTSDELPIPGAGKTGGSLRHNCDGSRWPRKLQEDAALLEAEYEQDPFNVRTVFYLANTYRDLGRYDEALSFYHLRVHLAGWQAEVEAAAEQARRIAAADYRPIVLPSAA